MDEILDFLGALMGGLHWLARGVLALLEGLVALLDIAELFGSSEKKRAEPAEAPAEGAEGRSPPE